MLGTGVWASNIYGSLAACIPRKFMNLKCPKRPPGDFLPDETQASHCLIEYTHPSNYAVVHRKHNVLHSQSLELSSLLAGIG